MFGVYKNFALIFTRVKTDIDLSVFITKTNTALLFVKANRFLVSGNCLLESFRAS